MFVIFLYQFKCTTANIVTLFDISSFVFIMMSIMQLVQIKRRAVEINNYICNSALGIENELQV